MLSISATMESPDPGQIYPFALSATNRAADAVAAEAPAPGNACQHCHRFYQHQPEYQHRQQHCHSHHNNKHQPQQLSSSKQHHCSPRLRQYNRQHQHHRQRQQHWIKNLHFVCFGKCNIANIAMYNFNFSFVFPFLFFPRRKPFIVVHPLLSVGVIALTACQPGCQSRHTLK